MCLMRLGVVSLAALFVFASAGAEEAGADRDASVLVKIGADLVRAKDSKAKAKELQDTWAAWKPDQQRQAIQQFITLPDTRLSTKRTIVNLLVDPKKIGAEFADWIPKHLRDKDADDRGRADLFSLVCSSRLSFLVLRKDRVTHAHEMLAEENASEYLRGRVLLYGGSLRNEGLLRNILDIGKKTESTVEQDMAMAGLRQAPKGMPQDLHDAIAALRKEMLAKAKATRKLSLDATKPPALAPKVDDTQPPVAPRPRGHVSSEETTKKRVDAPRGHPPLGPHARSAAGGKRPLINAKRFPDGPAHASKSWHGARNGAKGAAPSSPPPDASGGIALTILGGIAAAAILAGVGFLLGRRSAGGSQSD